MCAYGSCHETDTPITIGFNDTPIRFCTFAHVALWAKNRAKRNMALEANKISIADQIELGLFVPAKDGSNDA
jgi:hypothetical protein